MRSLRWAIRLTDNAGTTWVNGTYGKGADLITFHGISLSNQTIAFHIETILECNLTAYRNGTQFMKDMSEPTS